MLLSLKICENFPVDQDSFLLFHSSIVKNRRTHDLSEPERNSLLSDFEIQYMKIQIYEH